MAQILAQYRKVYGGSETLRYFAVDNLNSRRVVYDSNGTKTDAFEYSAFGECTQVSGSNSFLVNFTGKDVDATGLYYFNARYYDPYVGRFLQEDPSAQGHGWYTYCGNNPINLIDTDGRLEILPIDADKALTTIDRFIESGKKQGLNIWSNARTPFDAVFGFVQALTYSAVDFAIPDDWGEVIDWAAMGVMMGPLASAQLDIATQEIQFKVALATNEVLSSIRTAALKARYNLPIVGKIGGGVSAEDILSASEYANLMDLDAIVFFGSRQTTFSRKDRHRFRSNSDQDWRVVGDLVDIAYAAQGPWQEYIKKAEHFGLNPELGQPIHGWTTTGMRNGDLTRLFVLDVYRKTNFANTQTQIQNAIRQGYLVILPTLRR